MVGEEFLRAVQDQPGFVTVSMKLMASTEVDPLVRQASAIHFKNFIKHNWRVRLNFTSPLFSIAVGRKMELNTRDPCLT